MANGKGNGKVIDVGGGYKYTGRNVKPDEWWCPNAECQKCCPDPRGYYVFANRDTCNRCSAKKPKSPHLFRQSSYFKGTPTAGGGGGKGGKDGGGKGKGKGGADGGGHAKAGGEDPLDKELRELRERQKKASDREKQKEIDSLKRELDGTSRPKQSTYDANSMEVEEANGGESTQTTEKLQLEMDRREEDLKWWQGKLKEREDAPDPTNRTSHDVTKDRFEKARQAWWDSKIHTSRCPKTSAKRISPQ